MSRIGIPCKVGPTADSLAYLRTKKTESWTFVEPGNFRSRLGAAGDRGETVTQKD